MNYEKLEKNLKANGFAVSHFKTGKEAAEYLNAKIDGKSVGIGGSMSIKELGLSDMLRSHNNVIWHWEGDNPKDAMQSDVYLLTPNGLSENGEIVNIDGTCNRISSALFGHPEVYYLVGSNKVKENYEEALWYAQNVVSPKNAMRLNRKTPCAVKGDKCYHCSSPESICCALSVIWRKPFGIEYCEFVVVDEELGF